MEGRGRERRREGGREGKDVLRLGSEDRQLVRFREILEEEAIFEAQ